MTRVDLHVFLAGYLSEVDEHLRVAGTQLVAIEKAAAAGQASPRGVREVFRALHTIKGLSGMVGVEPIVAIAHAMESVLRAGDRAGGWLDAAAVDLLVQGVRAIEVRLRALAEHQPVAEPPKGLLDALVDAETRRAEAAGVPVAPLALPPELADKLTAAEHTTITQAVAAGRAVVRLEFQPTPARSERGITITSVRERVSALGEIVKVVPTSAPRGPDAPGGIAFVLLVVTDADAATLAGITAGEPAHVSVLVPARPAAVPAVDPAEERGGDGDGHERGTVRVEVARLDEALERLSALVVTRSRLARAVAELAGRGVDVRELGAVLGETSRQLRDLRAAITRARMVRALELLERLPLVARGVARGGGKLVRVALDPGRAELDKAVADRLFPALVHLVRNAVDHGIEAPERREAAGKPREAVVSVRCHERGGARLEVIVSDDGAGVDAAAVARRAGRPVPDDLPGLLTLLATPGLSTASAAQAASGRGLGVDIVKRVVVDELGGELELATTRGVGTTFVLRVPTSVTIVEAFTFETGGRVFVVPVASVDEIVEVEADGVTRSPPPPPGHPRVDLLRRRDEAVPLVDLNECLALPASALARRKAILVRRDGRRLGFAVDRMVGQQEIVVRPLEDRLVQVAGVSGTTDLGDGAPTLVVDLAALSDTGLRAGARA